MDSLKLIELLSNAKGAAGFEDQVLEAIRSQVGSRYAITEDSIRDLYLRRANHAGNKPVIMLDAHSDEVGFMVQAIKPNGTLRFIALGGWVDNTIPAHTVKIRNRKGEYVTGVVASKPPHFMSEAERSAPLSMEQMVIDIGASSAREVMEDYQIGVGAPVVPDVTFSYDKAHDLMLGKAFDCRLGCAAVLEVLEAFEGQDLPVDVVGALSTQEEMGTRGAQVTAQTVKPDIAIVFEGCPADDTFAEDYMIQTAIKRGPMLRHIDKRMITNPRFMRFALDTGARCGIPVQEAVRGGGSTNGAPIHVANESCPVIVIGFPVRYIHTHYGLASYADYRHGVNLAVEIIKQLNGDVIKSF